MLARLVAGQRSGRGGLRPLAVPLAVATGDAFAAPAARRELTRSGSCSAGSSCALAMVPLAIGLMERIEDETDRRLVGAVTAA